MLPPVGRDFNVTVGAEVPRFALMTARPHASSTTTNNHLQANSPSSMMTIDFAVEGKQKCIQIVLRGEIIGVDAETLRDFLAEALNFPANRWMLQMEDLGILSMRGVQSLVQFSQTIRQRGFIVEIQRIHPSVYTTLHELKLLETFEWAD